MTKKSAPGPIPGPANDLARQFTGDDRNGVAPAS